MQHEKRSPPPSKGEVAFRFVACTGIALALYYTPEVRWVALGSETLAAQLEDAPPIDAFMPQIRVCEHTDGRAFLLDAAMRGR